MVGRVAPSLVIVTTTITTYYYYHYHHDDGDYYYYRYYDLLLQLLLFFLSSDIASGISAEALLIIWAEANYREPSQSLSCQAQTKITWYYYYCYYRYYDLLLPLLR